MADAGHKTPKSWRIKADDIERRARQRRVALINAGKERIDLVIFHMDKFKTQPYVFGFFHGIQETGYLQRGQRSTVNQDSPGKPHIG